MVVECLEGTQRAALLVRCALICASLAACKVDKTPVGGLVLSLETDLSVPKDIDRIRLVIEQDGRVVREEVQQVGSGYLLLPVERRVTHPGNDRPFLFRATAYRGAEARIERSAITPVPRNFVGLLRLPLGFLCEGTALPDGGSACGLGNTCNLGSCGTAALESSQLPNYDLRLAAATSGGSPDGSSSADGGLLTSQIGDALSEVAAVGCFDVSACFASAQPIDIDVAGCSFRLPPEAASERISVALLMPLGSPGICDNGSCFVPLDLDTGAYSFGDGGEVLLPQAVCEKLLAGVPLQAAVSVRCGEKTSKHPPCGPWSSVQAPLPTRVIDSERPGAASTRTGLGEACAGAARQACGMCGTQARECEDGRWGEWGECMGQGSCTPGAAESCGRGGTRTCGGNCEWGACVAQTCSGPSAQACGNCGTQTRSCESGVWSSWSVCELEGECKPDATRSCGSSGTQACMGNCRWGSCSNQSCVGAPSEACGMCGTRTRSCDAASGMWSAFAECGDEGACAPGTTRPCGMGGVQACRGNCQWDSACAGQSCSGESTRACGQCGTQTRSCDSNTATWSEWSPCTGQGECAPDASRSCGSGGSQVCGGNCRWDVSCTGQSCSGPAQQGCRNCGVQTRSCDSNTGSWTDFSACTSQGACRPGASRSCGTGGMQVCTESCEWPSGCSMQDCSGPPAQACGNCGMQTRTCNSNTGEYGAWSSCTGQGTCAPGDTERCGGAGSRVCGDNCEWSAACNCPTGSHLCGGECVSNTSPETCGSACTPCPAPAGTRATCNGRSCGLECPSGQTLCGSSCVNLQTDAAHCGSCPRACAAREVCESGECECPAGQHRCDGRCVSNDSTATCGGSCTPCAAPSGATATCDGTRCGFSCPRGSSMCDGRCVNTSSDNNHCGTCGRMCMDGSTCQGGECGCPTGWHACNGQCARNTSPATCGTSCTPCVAPQGGSVSCDGTRCVSSCPMLTHDCNGTCRSDNADDSCGRLCSPCPAPPGMVGLCDDGRCITECRQGTHECNGECRSDTDVTACGFACIRCPDAPINGRTSCESGACVTTCPPTTHLCDGACVGDFAVNLCGENCLQCPYPANGTPTCVGGRCSVDCMPGFTRCTTPSGQDVCANINYDEEHCGGCNMRCLGRDICGELEDGTIGCEPEIN